MEAIDRTFFLPTGDHITRESLTLDAEILSLSLIFSHILHSENGFIEVEKFQEQKPSGFQFVFTVLLTLMLISSVSDLWFYPLPNCFQETPAPIHNSCVAVTIPSLPCLFPQCSM